VFANRSSASHVKQIADWADGYSIEFAWDSPLLKRRVDCSV
jgi:hypothetical protein